MIFPENLELQELKRISCALLYPQKDKNVEQKIFGNIFLVKTYFESLKTCQVAFLHKNKFLFHYYTPSLSRTSPGIKPFAAAALASSRAWIMAGSNPTGY